MLIHLLNRFHQLTTWRIPPVDTCRPPCRVGCATPRRPTVRLINQTRIGFAHALVLREIFPNSATDSGSVTIYRRPHLKR